jgi:hypothetical protein
MGDMYPVAGSPLKGGNEQPSKWLLKSAPTMSDLPIMRQARQRPRTAAFGLLTTGKDGDPMTLRRFSVSILKKAAVSASSVYS